MWQWEVWKADLGILSSNNVKPLFAYLHIMQACPVKDTLHQLFSEVQPDINSSKSKQFVLTHLVTIYICDLPIATVALCCTCMFSMIPCLTMTVISGCSDAAVVDTYRSCPHFGPPHEVDPLSYLCSSAEPCEALGGENNLRLVFPLYRMMLTEMVCFQLNFMFIKKSLHFFPLLINCLWNSIEKM